KRLLFPIPCCKFNEKFEMLDVHCPHEYNEYTNNIEIGCYDLLHEFVKYCADRLAFVSWNFFIN
ncbi:unnamed protein product, partial [Schistosoma turkestanicum]